MFKLENRKLKNENILLRDNILELNTFLQWINQLNMYLLYRISSVSQFNKLRF